MNWIWSLAFFFFLNPIWANPSSSTPPPNTTQCAACHGSKTQIMHTDWPYLNGQHANYLFKQLRDMKRNSARKAGVMAPLLASMSEQTMREYANYYQKRPLNQGQTAIQFLKRGETLYRGGDFERQITACIACHGPDGKGNAQAGFPVLSGQNPAYTIHQLQAFKTHERHNDLNEIMQDISKRMDDEDMIAVANYICGLH